VVARLREILPNGAARDKMLEGLARIKARLRVPGQVVGGMAPADRAADAVLALHVGSN